MKTLLPNKPKQQQVIVLSGAEYASEMQTRIDEAIAEGWHVVSVTAQHVAGPDRVARGGYFVVLEKDNAN